ncbi:MULTISPECIES: toxin-activating lysine-acyltransferase [unclassified Endozoicomonas]|uniref:toxin-activating lysine-acyltransferase n=1 Tax=unclassified Endozoicomonas TaxID=2644528 RepID=UPI003BB775B5
MSKDGLVYIAPQLNHCSFNEAEVLGSITWLWMHSKAHQNLPLNTLPRLLLPVLKTQQFVLGVDAGKPVFFLSWALFDEAAEQRYINQNPVRMPAEDWLCGERLWILDVVAPFSELKRHSQFMSKTLLGNHCWRHLYHNHERSGMLIKEFRGRNMSLTDARQWSDLHPLKHIPANCRYLKIGDLR